MFLEIFIFQFQDKLNKYILTSLSIRTFRYFATSGPISQENTDDFASETVTVPQELNERKNTFFNL
jgi:hypothetical protein